MASDACQLYSWVIPHRTFLPCIKLEVPMCRLLNDFLGILECILEVLLFTYQRWKIFFMKLKGGQDRLCANDARFRPYHLHNTQRQNSYQSISTAAGGDIRDSSHKRSPRTILRLYNHTGDSDEDPDPPHPRWRRPVSVVNSGACFSRCTPLIHTKFNLQLYLHTQ